MTLGQKIEALRKKNNLSQEKLADLLGVSRQTIYKWECDAVTPERPKLGQLIKLFSVSYDYLLDDTVEENAKFIPAAKQPNTLLEDKPAGSTQNTESLGQIGNTEPALIPSSSSLAQDVEEKGEPVPVASKEERKVLGNCCVCQKTIYEGDDHDEVNVNHGSARTYRYSTIDLYCRKCADEKQENEQRELEYRNNKAKKTGLIVGGILGVLCLVIGIIVVAINVVPESIAGGIVGIIFLSYALFAFTYCCFARNNFIASLFLEIAQFGFVKMPGVIFSLDLNGIVSLILIKCTLWVLGFLLALATTVLGFAISAFLAMFVFPFALRNSIQHPEKFDKD